MTRILFVIGLFLEANSNPTMLITTNIFRTFRLPHSGNVYQIFNILKIKDDPHKLSIFEIRDCKKRGYLNVLKATFRNTIREPTC